jgi:hypothetical protein
MNFKWLCIHKPLFIDMERKLDPLIKVESDEQQWTQYKIHIDIPWTNKNLPLFKNIYFEHVELKCL